HARGVQTLAHTTYIEKFGANHRIGNDGRLPRYVRKMSPGQRSAKRIAEIRMDIRELDPIADDFMGRVAAMREEIKRLEAKASRDAGPKWVADRKDDGTIQTIGEVLQSMDSGQK